MTEELLISYENNTSPCNLSKEQFRHDEELVVYFKARLFAKTQECFYLEKEYKNAMQNVKIYKDKFDYVFRENEKLSIEQNKYDSIEKEILFLTKIVKFQQKENDGLQKLAKQKKLDHHDDDHKESTTTLISSASPSSLSISSSQLYTAAINQKLTSKIGHLLKECYNLQKENTLLNHQLCQKNKEFHSNKDELQECYRQISQLESSLLQLNNTTTTNLKAHQNNTNTPTIPSIPSTSTPSTPTTWKANHLNQNLIPLEEPLHLIQANHCQVSSPYITNHLLSPEDLDHWNSMACDDQSTNDVISSWLDFQSDHFSLSTIKQLVASLIVKNNLSDAIYELYNLPGLSSEVREKTFLLLISYYKLKVKEDNSNVHLLEKTKKQTRPNYQLSNNNQLLEKTKKQTRPKCQLSKNKLPVPRVSNNHPNNIPKTKDLSFSTHCFYEFDFENPSKPIAHGPRRLHKTKPYLVSDPMESSSSHSTMSTASCTSSSKQPSKQKDQLKFHKVTKKFVDFVIGNVKECRTASLRKTYIHEHTICKECGKSPIVGRLWTCQGCQGYELCDVCYIEGTHGFETFSFLLTRAEEICFARCPLLKNQNELLDLLKNQICKTVFRRYFFCLNWIVDLLLGKSTKELKVRALEIPHVQRNVRRKFIPLFLALVSTRSDLEVKTEWTLQFQQEQHDNPIEILRIWIADQFINVSPFVENTKKYKIK